MSFTAYVVGSASSKSASGKGKETEARFAEVCKLPLTFVNFLSHDGWDKKILSGQVLKIDGLTGEVNAAKPETTRCIGCHKTHNEQHFGKSGVWTDGKRIIVISHSCAGGYTKKDKNGVDRHQLGYIERRYLVNPASVKNGKDFVDAYSIDTSSMAKK